MAEIVLEKEDIKKLIPHREPMLLLDQVTILGQTEAFGVYTVRGDEFFLQGHYPGDPLVPGNLQSEMLAQLGAVLICYASSFSDHVYHNIRKGKKPVLAALNNARFKNPGRPGDRLVIRITLTKDTGLVAYAEGSVCAENPVCAGDPNAVSEPRLLFSGEMIVALI